MTLNDLLLQYPDPDEAARVWAKQEGIAIDAARFEIAIAIGESDGDVMQQVAQGSAKAKAAFPLKNEGLP